LSDNEDPDAGVRLVAGLFAEVIKAAIWCGMAGFFLRMVLR
jgi:hypothetical protein